MINGYLTALTCPPMNRLFYVPRAAALKDLAEQFPPESDREVKAKEKQKIIDRVELRKQNNTRRSELIVRGFFV